MKSFGENYPISKPTWEPPRPPCCKTTWRPLSMYGILPIPTGLGQRLPCFEANLGTAQACFAQAYWGSLSICGNLANEKSKFLSRGVPFFCGEASLFSQWSAYPKRSLLCLYRNTPWWFPGWLIKRLIFAEGFYRYPTQKAVSTVGRSSSTFGRSPKWPRNRVTFPDGFSHWPRFRI
jgi:hypothetical protein